MSLMIVAIPMEMNAEVVSLDSCRQMAIHNNKMIQMADKNIESAGYLNKAAKAAYLPGLDFNMSYFYNQHKIALLGEDSMLPTMSFNPSTGSYNYNILTNASGEPVLNPSTGSYIPTEVAVIPKEALTYDIHNVVAGAVTLTQPVYMGGAIRAMNEITHYAGELARSMRNSAVQDVVYAVDEAYWQVVSLKEKQRLADSYVCLVDTFLYNVNAMYDQGVATRSDILSVQVKANEASITQTKVNNGLSLSRMALAQICGLPIDTQLELSDEALRDEPGEAAPVTYNMEDVYAARQDLQSLRHGISIYQQKEKLALSEMMPKLAIVGAYAFSNPNTIDGFQKRFGGGFSVGATLTVPLWHWGGNYNKYKAAQVETASQRLLLDDAQEKVNLQVSQARFKYEEAYKTYNMTVTNQQKADENLRQAELGFREGVLTTDDVIAAQTAWLQAHSEKIDAEIAIRLCNVYLSKVLGTMSY
jgi:outer membrane protein TolC